jgi:N-acetylneuraminic acid mutarotase
VSATALDGKLYVVAFDGKMERNVMMRYDEATDEWRTLAALATYHGGQRRIASAAALDGKIYVAGGWDTDSDCGRAAVESYDPTSDTWHPVAPMNVARKDFCLVAAQGCLFAIGGETNESWSSDSVEKYDSKTNVWTPVRGMSRGYTHMAAAVVVDSDKGTAIVTLGGRSRDEDGNSFATNECNTYYPAIDKWDDKWDRASTIRLPKAAEGIGAAMVGGVLWCFGGSDGESAATGAITCTTPQIDVQDKTLVFWNPIIVGRDSYEYGFITITAPKHLEMPPSSFITCVAI